MIVVARINVLSEFEERQLTVIKLSKNAGWCGTPPISYSDYPGTWTILNDTLVEINVGYWGGTTIYKLDVESVSENSLKVVLISDIN